MRPQSQQCFINCPSTPTPVPLPRPPITNAVSAAAVQFLHASTQLPVLVMAGKGAVSACAILTYPNWSFVPAYFQLALLTGQGSVACSTSLYLWWSCLGENFECRPDAWYEVPKLKEPAYAL